jgi:hypothetical protein
MATLVPQDGHAHLERLELQPGINTIGRRDTNSLVVPDASVSGQHCEIVVENGTINLRDLGSTNGTYLDGQPVRETALADGQKLTLGDVPFLVEAPETARAKPAGLRVTLGRSAAVAAEPPPVVGRTAAEAIAAIQPVMYEERSFFAQIPGSFAYPFNKSGVMMLIFGSIVFVVLEFLGSFSFWLQMIGLAYLFAFMQKVIAHSAQGEDEIPPWPELSDIINDIILPCLMVVGCLVVSFGPALLLFFLSRESPVLGVAAIAAAGVGALYLPMAFLAVAVSDSFLALSPHIVLPSIVRIFGPYLVAFLVIAALAGIRFAAGLGEAFIPDEQVPLRIAATLAMGLVSLYILTVEMRILGLLFRSYRDRLGWLG